jgi:hypothetical protein
MFPRFDYLFNIALVAACVYIGLVVGNLLFNFALTILGV